MKIDQCRNSAKVIGLLTGIPGIGEYWQARALELRKKILECHVCYEVNSTIKDGLVSMFVADQDDSHSPNSSPAKSAKYVVVRNFIMAAGVSNMTSLREVALSAGEIILSERPMGNLSGATSLELRCAILSGLVSLANILEDNKIDSCAWDDDDKKSFISLLWTSVRAFIISPENRPKDSFFHGNDKFSGDMANAGSVFSAKYPGECMNMLASFNKEHHDMLQQAVSSQKNQADTVLDCMIRGLERSRAISKRVQTLVRELTPVTVS